MSTEIVDYSTKRDGQCSLRSSKGMAILDETYYFLVKATQVDEPYINVLATPGLPLVNITLSPSGYGVCKTKNATRWAKNPLYWDVQCDFSSEVGETQSGQDPTSDPVAWTPVYETKWERMQEVVTSDADNEPIVNSAGQAFDDGLTRTRMIPIWEFYQFESATITDEQIIERNEKVNLNEFRGRAPKTLLLGINSSVIGFFYGQPRRLTQYSLRYNTKNWTRKRLDVGTSYLDVGTSTLLPYTDAEGNVIRGGLNSLGAPVTAGDPPAILSFDEYEAISFDFIRV